MKWEKNVGKISDEVEVMEGIKVQEKWVNG